MAPRTTLVLGFLSASLLACSGNGLPDAGPTTAGGTSAGPTSTGSATNTSGGTTSASGTSAGSSGGGTTASSTGGGTTSGASSSSGGSTGGTTGPAPGECPDTSTALPDGGFLCGGDTHGGPDTWCNYAQCFFSTYCVSCHNPNAAGASSAQDFRQYSQVQLYAPIIRCGVSSHQDSAWDCSSLSFPTSARQFPVGSGPKPDDANRDRLVAWIDAGLQ
jgi:hypothetical protein